MLASAQHLSRLSMSVEEIRIDAPLREAGSADSEPSDARPTTPAGVDVLDRGSPQDSQQEHAVGGSTKLEVRPVSSGSEAPGSLSVPTSPAKGVRFEVSPEPKVSLLDPKMAGQAWKPDGDPNGSRLSGRGARTSAYPGRVNSPEEIATKSRRTVQQRLQQTRFYHGQTASRLRACLHGKTFVLIMTLALLIALFLPEIWVLAGINSNTLIDILMTMVMTLFVFEFVALSALDATYFLSFFFVMDIVGTLSMIFDISYMVGTDNTQVTFQDTSAGASSKNNLMLLRAARAARVGARAGRLSRVLRILRFLPFLSASKEDQSKGIAGSISRQLANLLAIRVAALTIILVMVIPAFDILSFPQNDHSLQAWVERLSVDAAENTALGTNLLYRELDAMVLFFDKRSYGPYTACWGVSVGDEFKCTKNVVSSFGHPAPERSASALWVHTGTFMVGFNMHETHMLDKGLAMVNIFFIICIMVFSGLALSNVVTELAVRPLERMLRTVREIANTVFKMSTGVEKEGEDEEGEEFDINSSSEMKLLEKVVAKLAIIADLQNSQGVPHVEEGMGDEDVGILNMMQGKDVVQDFQKQASRRASVAQKKKAARSGDQTQLSEAGVTEQMYNSYLFNTLALSKGQMTVIGCYAISRFHDDGDWFVQSEEEKATLVRFFAAVEKEYLNNAFHNFSHATDVLHGVAKMLRLTNSENFLTELEQFSLLIAAIGHDIGHPGVNNGFLSEVGHELALQYNDLSPLENHHVSKLYSIIQIEETNVFSVLSKEHYKEVRKYCIETILHTDMMGHQAMVKDLTMLFQMNLEVFTGGLTGSAGAPGPEVDIFAQPDTKLLIMENILHSADVSNPCRSWEVSYAWAMCVLEEFFSQGDQEKMLGVPVQMLNDREKVNRPNSQIGFLEFLIAPFFAAQIRLFHNLHEYGDHLAHNIVKWEDMWAEEGKPNDEARAKVRNRVEKIITNLEEATHTSAPHVAGTISTGCNL